jgi:hypothetical protein
MNNTKVTVEELIKYNSHNWTLQVGESESGGISYTLYAYPKSGGQNWILTTFDTSELVSLKQLIDQAVTNIHPDRDKILS